MVQTFGVTGTVRFDNPRSATHIILVTGIVVERAADTVTLSDAIVVENKGGGPFSLVGDLAAGSYFVTVNSGESPPPPVYNGRAGSGGREVVFEEVSPGVTRSTADVYLPPMPVGGPYTFTFTPTAGGLGTDSNPAVTVVPETFDSRTSYFRRLMPPRMRLGPRQPADKEFPQS